MKIAVICTLFFSKEFHGAPYQNEKSLLDVYKKCVEVLFKSGKKYFLSNHEIEFLLITNQIFQGFCEITVLIKFLLEETY